MTAINCLEVIGLKGKVDSLFDLAGLGAPAADLVLTLQVAESVFVGFHRCPGGRMLLRAFSPPS